MITLKWALTNNCNLKCKHCYNADIRNEKDYIPLNTAFRIISSFKNNYVTNVQLLGGEPLVYPYIKDVIKKLHEENIGILINTNGTLVDSALCDIIIDCVSTMIFSIDGPNDVYNDRIRGRGTFDSATKGLENILKLKNRNKKLKIIVNTVLSNCLLNDLDTYIDFVEKYRGVDRFVIGLPDNMGNAKMNKDFSINMMDYFAKMNCFVNKIHAKRLEDRIIIDASKLYLFYLNSTYNTNYNIVKSDYCQGGLSTYFIDADGIIYPCNLPAGITYFKEVIDKEVLNKYFNILNCNFHDIITRTEFVDFFKHSRKTFYSNTIVNYSEICCRCPLLEFGFCSCGCHLNYQNETKFALCKIVESIYGNNLFRDLDVYLSKEKEY